MPSFDYQKKKKNSEKKKKVKKLKGPIVQNVEIESFWLIFFTEINVFVITQRVKYRKKVPLGTSTEFQVPIPVQMWTVPNPNN